MEMYKKLLAVMVLILVFAATAPAAEEFPLRAQYPKVAIIELEDMFKQIDNLLVFDVRSTYEYETLHMSTATHLALNDPEFKKKLATLRTEEQKPFVFYCNGHTCKKSYQAAQKATQSGINNVYAFDAGIFDWTKAHPDLAVLLGKSPVDTNDLISKEKLNAHMLKPEEFGNRIGDNTILLDIRDTQQKNGISLFPMRQHSVPLDNKKLKSYVDEAKRSGKTLLIYDAVGKQVRWLQYYLEAEKVPKYYFMEGGAQAFLGY